MGFYDADHDVDAASLESMAFLEHLVGLADARGEADDDRARHGISNVIAVATISPANSSETQRGSTRCCSGPGCR